MIPVNKVLRPGTSGFFGCLWSWAIPQRSPKRQLTVPSHPLWSLLWAFPTLTFSALFHFLRCPSSPTGRFPSFNQTVLCKFHLEFLEIILKLIRWIVCVCLSNANQRLGSQLKPKNRNRLPTTQTQPLVQVIQISSLSWAVELVKWTCLAFEHQQMLGFLIDLKRRKQWSHKTTADPKASNSLLLPWIFEVLTCACLGFDYQLTVEFLIDPKRRKHQEHNINQSHFTKRGSKKLNEGEDARRQNTTRRCDLH